jgi:hypothetical protein
MMNEIEYIDFQKQKGSHLTKNALAVATYKDKTHKIYRIALNVYASQIVMDKKLDCVRIAINKLTSQRFLVFTKGVGLTFPTHTRKGQINISCKDMCVYLRNTFGMREDEVSLWISDDLSQTNDIATFEIRKQKEL